MSAGNARVQDWMWAGPSGRRVTPAELANALEDAAQLLQRKGWDPKDFGIERAVAGSDDLRVVAYRMVQHQLGAEIRDRDADLRSWEGADVRTTQDVIGLLTRTARMVRVQGAVR